MVGVIRIKCTFGKSHSLPAKAPDRFQSGNLGRHCPRRHALDLIRIRTFGHQLAKKGIEPLVDLSDIGAGTDIGGDFGNAYLCKGLQACRDAHGKLFIADERIIEPGTGKAAKDSHAYRKRHCVWIVEAGGYPPAIEPGRCHLILHDFKFWRC